MTRRIILVDIGAGLTLRGVLPSVALFATYAATLKASGGQAPYTYSIAAGTLPAGLYLDAATGIISGTATAAGTAAFTVRATDISGTHVDRLYSINVIAEPLTLSGDAPDGTTGTPYSYAYATTGGVPPYVYSLVAGALPAGVTLDAGTGALSGTPTSGGALSWTVRVTDADGATFDLADSANFAYTTLALAGNYAAATVGTAYSSDLTIAGGDGTYSNPRITVGALPAGLALSIVAGKLRLSGTPTAAATSNFTAAVDSSDGQTATSAQSVVVSASTVYATWDATKKPSQITINSPNDAMQNATNSQYASIGSTTGKSSGKWLFRMKCTNKDFFAGIGSIYPDPSAGDQFPWVNSYFLGRLGSTVGNSMGFENWNGQMFACSRLGGSTNTASATGVAANTYLTVAVDLDSSPQKVAVYSGNTLLNSLAIPSPAAGLVWYPCASTLVATDVCTLDAGATTPITIPTPLVGQGYHGYWG